MLEDKVREFLKKNFEEAIVREDNFRNQQSFYIKREYLYDICRALKTEPELEFILLSDICSLDWLGDVEEKEGRFEVIYNLYSLKSKFRLLLKVRLADSEPSIDTVTTIWQGANWMEREVFDLMGITFVGHPDLRKIVTPDELEGYPLRKDYPLTYELPQFSYNKNGPPEVIL
jgi:NADH-quinone oxidoreductase subunit C